MRALNVLLCFVVSLLLAALVLEVGLRLVGMGPQSSINQFDEVTGWSKIKNHTSVRSTREFKVHTTTNALGLRDDPLPSFEKPAGRFRVLMLGDSFVQGYTVEREDLFVDLLEHWWQHEGRDVDVINAGTEAWSTDQEALWFDSVGKRFQADLVVLVPYENDLYWNSKTQYLRFPKPRFSPDAGPEKLVLRDPGPRPWTANFALTAKFLGGEKPPSWSPNGTRQLDMEVAAYWHAAPEFMRDAYARTRGAMRWLKERVEASGAKLVVAPIPNKAAIESDARQALVSTIQASGPIASLRRAIFGGADPESDPTLATSAWSPDRPVETVLALASELGIPALDARAALRARAEQGERLYYQSDWHFDPNGNRAFATFLHDELERGGFVPASHAAKNPITRPDPPRQAPKIPTWGYVFAGLWLALGTLYSRLYKDTAAWKAYLGVGLLLGSVFAIALGGGVLLGKLSPQWAQIGLIAFVVGVLTFVIVKLGSRVGTITELLWAFTRRGHWYLMPLVVILLSVGSLLVVAASSPLVAPFIYTLF